MGCCGIWNRYSRPPSGLTATTFPGTKPGVAEPLSLLPPPSGTLCLGHLEHLQNSYQDQPFTDHIYHVISPTHLCSFLLIFLILFFWWVLLFCIAIKTTLLHPVAFNDKDNDILYWSLFAQLDHCFSAKSVSNDKKICIISFIKHFNFFLKIIFLLFHTTN